MRRRRRWGRRLGRWWMSCMPVCVILILDVLDLHCAGFGGWRRRPKISPVPTSVPRVGLVSQIHTAITLRHRLPRVAKELRCGVLDYRMVATMIARTENVDDEVIGWSLDEAIAGHVMEWMKLSTPKLRDPIDQWGHQIRSAGVRVHLPLAGAMNGSSAWWTTKGWYADLGVLLVRPVPPLEAPRRKTVRGLARRFRVGPDVFRIPPRSKACPDSKNCRAAPND